MLGWGRGRLQGPSEEDGRSAIQSVHGSPSWDLGLGMRSLGGSMLLPDSVPAFEGKSEICLPSIPADSSLPQAHARAGLWLD